MSNLENIGSKRAFCPMHYQSAEQCQYLFGKECRVQWSPVDSTEETQLKKTEGEEHVLKNADENGISWKTCCFK